MEGGHTCSVDGGCVGTDPKLICGAVPFVIAGVLLIGVVIDNGVVVECVVVLAIGGRVVLLLLFGAKPLDNVTKGLACGGCCCCCCDCVCECC